VTQGTPVNGAVVQSADNGQANNALQQITLPDGQIVTLAANPQTQGQLVTQGTPVNGAVVQSADNGQANNALQQIILPNGQVVMLAANPAPVSTQVNGATALPPGTGQLTSGTPVSDQKGPSAHISGSTIPGADPTNTRNQNDETDPSQDDVDDEQPAGVRQKIEDQKLQTSVHKARHKKRVHSDLDDDPDAYWNGDDSAKQRRDDAGDDVPSSMSGSEGDEDSATSGDDLNEQEEQDLDLALSEAE